uniref:Uncharacterized protein n=1 Tax=Oryctolagus cuniculus TaxID=9986 RepID=A0A5F9CFB3_RABIT
MCPKEVSWHLAPSTRVDGGVLQPFTLMLSPCRRPRSQPCLPTTGQMESGGSSGVRLPPALHKRQEASPRRSQPSAELPETGALGPGRRHSRDSQSLVSVGAAVSTCPSVPCAVVVRRLRQEKTDTVRCIKSCRPSHMACLLDPVHTISHTVISLPTFREFSHPEGEWRGWGGWGRGNAALPPPLHLPTAQTSPRGPQPAPLSGHSRPRRRPWASILCQALGKSGRGPGGSPSGDERRGPAGLGQQAWRGVGWCGHLRNQAERSGCTKQGRQEVGWRPSQSVNLELGLPPAPESVGSPWKLQQTGDHPGGRDTGLEELGWECTACPVDRRPQRHVRGRAETMLPGPSGGRGWSTALSTSLPGCTACEQLPPPPAHLRPRPWEEPPLGRSSPRVRLKRGGGGGLCPLGKHPVWTLPGLPGQGGGRAGGTPCAPHRRLLPLCSGQARPLPWGAQAWPGGIARWRLL